MSVKRKVARGAQFLDRVNPKWYIKVVPHRLDIRDDNYCVLGQLYGTYHGGALNWVYENHKHPIIWMFRHGFATLRRFEDRRWEKLRADWLAEIRVRVSAEVLQVTRQHEFNRPVVIQLREYRDKISA